MTKYREAADPPQGSERYESLKPRLEALMQSGLERRLFSGAALALTEPTGATLELCVGAHGFEAEAAPVTPRSRFDLASLTKICVTTPLFLRALGRGELRLEDTVADFFPAGSVGEDLAATSLRELLMHTSGLPPHVPLAAITGGSNEAAVVRKALLNLKREAEPGSRVAYSCMGFLILGEILQALYGQSLERIHRTKILAPAGLEGPDFRPEGPTVRTRDLSTGRLLEDGIAHDENARFLGGVAANAGAFGNLRSLEAWAKLLLGGGEPLLAPAVLELARRNHTPQFAEHRGLGYFLGSTLGTSLGDLAAGAYGHTGFTGTSFMVHPERKLAIIFLSNSIIQPESSVEALRLRARLHNLIYAEHSRRG